MSVQPDGPQHGIEGLKHMESAIVPAIYDPALADEDLRIGSERSYEMVRRLAREEGLLVGISAGANVWAACQVAAQMPSDQIVVTVLCDTGERYLSVAF